MLGSTKQCLWELTMFFQNKNFIFLVRRMSFCYILKSHVTICLIENNLNCRICFRIESNVYCLVGVCEENITSGCLGGLVG